MTVFDVGANVGFFTLLASRLVGPTGHVIAVEPLPRNVAFLERHVALNKAANVTIVRLAVSDKAGFAHFVEAESPSMGRLGHGALRVETTTLDRLSESYGVPDLVKMDIEGGEVMALAAAGRVLARRAALYLSTHGYARHEQCLRQLELAGYSLTVTGSADSGHQDVRAIGA
jgi:FkbM family methyltransferase